MKILASRYEGYILDVTETELANILGYSSKYSDEFKRADINDAIKKATPIMISNIYSDYERIRYYKSDSNLKEASKRLIEMAKALEPIEEIIRLLPSEKK